MNFFQVIQQKPLEQPKQQSKNMKDIEPKLQQQK